MYFIFYKQAKYYFTFANIWHFKFDLGFRKPPLARMAHQTGLKDILCEGNVCSISGTKNKSSFSPPNIELSPHTWQSCAWKKKKTTEKHVFQTLWWICGYTKMPLFLCPWPIKTFKFNLFIHSLTLWNSCLLHMDKRLMRSLRLNQNI